MVEKKITIFDEIPTPTVDDVVLGVTDTSTTPVSGKIKLSSIIALLPAASAAETTAGTETGKFVCPDGLAGSGYGKRPAQVNLNANFALTTNDKSYVDITSEKNGWNLVAVYAKCTAASSSGAVTITVKNGATSMLSTNLTIDQGQTGSDTAATPAVIDTENDHVATGNRIEVACSGAGTGVTYLAVTLTFQAP